MHFLASGDECLLSNTCPMRARVHSATEALKVGTLNPSEMAFAASGKRHCGVIKTDLHNAPLGLTLLMNVFGNTVLP